MQYSVIIPVYNVGKYLEDCLESILVQVKNRSDVEILLIDDGSTDDSGTICDQYGANYPELIQVFHNKNVGLLLTRRYGFLKAQGEYIINCDSDDILESKYIETIDNVIKKYNSPDVILFNINLWTGNKKDVFYQDVFTKNQTCLVEKKDLLNRFFKENTVISMCGKVFKKSCLDLSIDYSVFLKKSFGEDTVQSAEIYSHSNSFVYVNKQLYNYRNDSGMTKKYNPTYYQDFREINQFIYKYKDSLDLNNYDELYAIKLFTVVGRTITQSGYNKHFKYKEFKKNLEFIRNDDHFKKNISFWDDIKNELKGNYKILCKLLLSERYLTIYLILKIKSLASN